MVGRGFSLTIITLGCLLSGMTLLAGTAIGVEAWWECSPELTINGPPLGDSLTEFFLWCLIMVVIGAALIAFGVMNCKTCEGR